MDLYADRLSAHVKTQLANVDIDWSCDGVALELIKAYKGNLSLIIEDAKIEDIANYLIGHLHPDGFWNVPWNWNAYPDEWAVSKNWWKAYGIIVNMLFMKEHGKCV